MVDATLTAYKCLENAYKGSSGYQSKLGDNKDL